MRGLLILIMLAILPTCDIDYTKKAESYKPKLEREKIKFKSIVDSFPYIQNSNMSLTLGTAYVYMDDDLNLEVYEIDSSPLMMRCSEILVQVLDDSLLKVTYNVLLKHEVLEDCEHILPVLMYLKNDYISSIRIGTTTLSKRLPQQTPVFHTVKPGETVSSVALYYNTSTDSLYKYNPLLINDPVLNAGSKIQVKNESH